MLKVCGPFESLTKSFRCTVSVVAMVSPLSAVSVWTALSAVSAVVATALTATGCLPRDEDVGRTRVSRDVATNAQTPGASTVTKPKPVGSSTPTASVRPDPMIESEFVDKFDRPHLGPNWRPTSAAWKIEDGRLCVAGAHNHPAWLRRRLPTNAILEFDATSYSPDGDIKAEFWGDGRSSATSAAYDNATSYLTIWGGWKNQFHVLARIDEHADDRKQIALSAENADPRATRVVPEKTYHFRVERKDSRTVQWFVDGKDILTYADPEALRGTGHEHFGYNNWAVRVCFDNLKVTPLP